MSIQKRGAALVTGASRGIGASIAVRLAKEGYAVAVNYMRNRDQADAVVNDIRRSGGTAVAIRGDVRDPAAVAATFDEATRELGALSLLVNNAGVMSLAPIAELDDLAFDAMVEVNFRGTFNCLREAARRFGVGARIINISTTVTRTLYPTYAVYAATKAAVEAMTLVLARELRGRGITVNTIAPGPTATDLFLDGKSPELVQTLAQGAPLGRLGAPEDIANVIAMIAGSDAGWVNGQTIFANGGVA
ncbi:MAG: SDR family oxidoreductase [Rhizomicrobium sp.]